MKVLIVIKKVFIWISILIAALAFSFAIGVGLAVISNNVDSIF